MSIYSCKTYISLFNKKSLLITLHNFTKGSLTSLVLANHLTEQVTWKPSILNDFQVRIVNNDASKSSCHSQKQIIGMANIPLQFLKVSLNMITKI